MASSTPTNAPAAPTTNTPKPTEAPSAKPTASAAANPPTAESEQVDVELPPSALQKARDIDGVQLMHKRQSLSEIGDEEAIAELTMSKGAQNLRSVSDSPQKMLVYEVDPQHYRKLVKGIIPIRSSLMKANVDGSTTDVHRKSVHFSDESGFNLSFVRNFDKPVRMMT